MIFLLVVTDVLLQINAQCTFPDSWNGTWYDSLKGNITFDQSSGAISSGWDLSAYSSDVTSWTCVMESTADNLFLMRGDQPIDVIGTDHAAYLCLKVTKITDYSYRYQILADEQLNANGERISIIDENVRTISVTSVCIDVVQNGPGVEEYHVWVKQENMTDVKQYCPEPLLGTFSYTHDSGSTQTCASNSLLDVCSDRSTLVYNYSLCATEQGFSKEGLLYCVTNVEHNGTYYVSLLNPGIIETDQNRFTCYALVSTGEIVYVSDNAGSCAKGQDSKVKQTDGSGTLTLQAYVLCPFTSDSATDTCSVGIIVGSVVGGVVFLFLIAFVCIICWRKKLRSKLKRVWFPKTNKKPKLKDDENVSNGHLAISQPPTDEKIKLHDDFKISRQNTDEELEYLRELNRIVNTEKVREGQSTPTGNLISTKGDDIFTEKNVFDKPNKYSNELRNSFQSLPMITEIDDVSSPTPRDTKPYCDENSNSLLIKGDRIIHHHHKEKQSIKSHTEQPDETLDIMVSPKLTSTEESFSSVKVIDETIPEDSMKTRNDGESKIIKETHQPNPSSKDLRQINGPATLLKKKKKLNALEKINKKLREGKLKTPEESEDKKTEEFHQSEPEEDFQPNTDRLGINDASSPSYEKFLTTVEIINEKSHGRANNTSDDSESSSIKDLNQSETEEKVVRPRTSRTSSLRSTFQNKVNSIDEIKKESIKGNVYKTEIPEGSDTENNQSSHQSEQEKKDEGIFLPESKGKHFHVVETENDAGMKTPEESGIKTTDDTRPRSGSDSKEIGFKVENMKEKSNDKETETLNDRSIQITNDTQQSALKDEEVRSRTSHVATLRSGSVNKNLPAVEITTKYYPEEERKTPMCNENEIMKDKNRPEIKDEEEYLPSELSNGSPYSMSNKSQFPSVEIHNNISQNEKIKAHENSEIKITRVTQPNLTDNDVRSRSGLSNENIRPSFNDNTSLTSTSTASNLTSVEVCNVISMEDGKTSPEGKEIWIAEGEHKPEKYERPTTAASVMSISNERSSTTPDSINSIALNDKPNRSEDEKLKTGHPYLSKSNAKDLNSLESIDCRSPDDSKNVSEDVSPKLYHSNSRRLTSDKKRLNSVELINSRSLDDRNYTSEDVRPRTSYAVSRRSLSNVEDLNYQEQSNKWPREAFNSSVQTSVAQDLKYQKQFSDMPLLSIGPSMVSMNSRSFRFINDTPSSDVSHLSAEQKRKLRLSYKVPHPNPGHFSGPKMEFRWI